MWKTQTSNAEPSDATKHIQRTWDNLGVSSTFTDLLSTCTIPVEKAKLKAVTALHAGDWLNAPSIAAVGLRLSAEAIRVEVGLRLGSTICQQHNCICGSPVDAWGLHGLSFRKSGPRHIRHSQLNDQIWRAIKRAQMPVTKEPVGLSRTDGKIPDGATLIPRTRGKPLAWDVTVPDTYAQSHIGENSRERGAAATKAAIKKTTKYACVTTTHQLVPIAIETGGP